MAESKTKPTKASVAALHSWYRSMGGSSAESVATAMIEVNEPVGYSEYVGPDLLLQISRGGVTITETILYYDCRRFQLGGSR